MENLDLACARCGRELAGQGDERLLTRALSVLEAQGVYAFFLFLEQQQKGRERSHPVADACVQFLQSHPHSAGLINMDQDNLLVRVSRMAEDLEDLLLAHQLLRQALVYARHHAKLNDTESKP